MTYELVPAARTIDLGKDGSKWEHGYIPLNAAAVALKNHKSPGGSDSKSSAAAKLQIQHERGVNDARRRGFEHGRDSKSNETHAPGYDHRTKPYAETKAYNEGHKAGREHTATIKRQRAADSQEIKDRAAGMSAEDARSKRNAKTAVSDRDKATLQAASADQLVKYRENYAQGSVEHDAVNTEIRRRLATNASDSNELRSHFGMTPKTATSERNDVKTVPVYNVKTGKIEHVSQAEATAGHIRYGQSLGAGTAAAGQTVKNALDSRQESLDEIATRNMGSDLTKAKVGSLRVYASMGHQGSKNELSRRAAKSSAPSASSATTHTSIVKQKLTGLEGYAPTDLKRIAKLSAGPHDMNHAPAETIAKAEAELRNRGYIKSPSGAWVRKGAPKVVRVESGGRHDGMAVYKGNFGHG